MFHLNDITVVVPVHVKYKVLGMNNNKSRLAIRVLNYCRPHINAKHLDDVADTLFG